MLQSKLVSFLSLLYSTASDDDYDDMVCLQFNSNTKKEKQNKQKK